MCCELSHLSSFLVGGSAQLMAASCARDALAQLTAEDAAQAVTAACAAVSMSFTTSSGCETIATWFVGTSTVVAPMRLANRRSASGGIAWSPSATRNQDGSRQRLLHRVHDLCLHRINVSGEVVHKVVLWQPGEALLVDDEVRQCRGHRSLREQRADGFALVESEGRDVDQTDDARRVCTKRGDDLAAVGVASDDGRAALQGQHLT